MHPFALQAATGQLTGQPAERWQLNGCRKNDEANFGRQLALAPKETEWVGSRDPERTQPVLSPLTTEGPHQAGTSLEWTETQHLAEVMTRVVGGVEQLQQVCGHYPVGVAEPQHLARILAPLRQLISLAPPQPQCSVARIQVNSHRQGEQLFPAHPLRALRLSVPRVFAHAVRPFRYSPRRT